MDLVIFSAIVAVILLIQLTMYKNIYKIIKLRNKLGLGRKSFVFNRNDQAGFLEDVNSLRRGYKVNMTVTIVVYLIIMAAQLIK